MWQYPRPPALERSDRRVVVRAGSIVLADTTSAWRVMETSHPPTWYIPRSDIDERHLRLSSGRSSVCEWKGAATYWDVIGVGSGAGSPGGDTIPAVGWSYEHPTPRFVPITGHLSFMPGQIECYVDDERVQPQAGGFYGGWITRDVVGPFKGEPGSWGW